MDTSKKYIRLKDVFKSPNDKNVRQMVSVHDFDVSQLVVKSHDYVQLKNLCCAPATWTKTAGTML